MVHLPLDLRRMATHRGTDVAMLGRNGPNVPTMRWASTSLNTNSREREGEGAGGDERMAGKASKTGRRGQCVGPELGRDEGQLVLRHEARRQ